MLVPYGPAAAVFVIARSASAITVVVAMALLFAGFPSELEVVTVAVFVTGPGVDGKVNVSAIVADPPFVNVPIEHVTVVVPLQVP